MTNDNSTPHKATEYDGEIARTVPFYGRFHKEAIDLVRHAIPKPSVWLDTGCGTGNLVEQAFALFPETLFLLSDPSPAMLAHARARLSAFSSRRISFIGEFKTESLGGVVPEAPQVITAIQSHHYGDVEARRKATDVCYRLLEMGGMYITFENIRPDTDRGTRVALDRWCGFQLEAGRSPAAVKDHRARFGKEYFPIGVCEHLRLLRTAGFVAAELFWLSYMQAGFFAIK